MRAASRHFMRRYVETIATEFAHFPMSLRSKEYSSAMHAHVITESSVEVMA